MLPLEKHHPSPCQRGVGPQSGNGEAYMSDLMKNIDERSKLAGTNKLELLLFSLGVDSRTGRKETFGINVFKVREVMRTPPITAAPEMPEAVEGMVSLRGVLVPVVDLGRYAHIAADQPREIMIVTEYNGHTQGFLVDAVDTILRLDWAQMKVPPEMLTARMGGLVTAITELQDGRLVMLLDVERVLSDTTHFDDELIFRDIKPIGRSDALVLFADDSTVARRQVQTTLERMEVRFIASVNGRQAWDELQKLARHAETLGRPVRYMLTKLIKSDARFAGIPVLMHSSLSGASNQKLGSSVGVDEYVSKFEPQQLALSIARLLRPESVPLNKPAASPVAA
jgi:two-component system chemotaxis response regulator CheV